VAYQKGGQNVFRRTAKESAQIITRFKLITSFTLVMTCLFALVPVSARAVIYSGNGLTVQGFVDLLDNVSLTGPNPANILAHTVGARAGASVNVFRPWMRLEFSYAPPWGQSENFTSSAFLRWRTSTDWTSALNGNLRWNNFNAYPLTQPSGWLLREQQVNFMSEMEEGFVDLKWKTDHLGDFWLRLGKQQIIWGTVPAFRTFDVWNPLDLSQQLLLTQGGQFVDQIIIPEWAVRATYSLPSDWLPRHLDQLAIESDFNPGDQYPQQWPAPGAPYAVFPSNISLIEANMHGRWSVGNRLIMSFRDGTEMDLGWMTKPQDVNPVPNSLMATGTLSTLVGNPMLGLHLPFLPKGKYLNIGLLNQHPRVWNVGGSLNRMFAFSGEYTRHLTGVLSAETLFTPDLPMVRAFAHPARSKIGKPDITGKIVRRPQWVYTLDYANQNYIFPTENPLITILVFSEQWRMGDLQHTNFEKGGYRDQEFLLLSFTQPLLMKFLNPGLLLIYDVKGSYRLTPNVSYQYHDNWLLNVWFDIIGGNKGIFAAQTPIATEFGTEITFYL
jgi:Protein of unknown function (DUF1302)